LVFSHSYSILIVIEEAGDFAVAERDRIAAQAGVTEYGDGVADQQVIAVALVDRRKPQIGGQRRLGIIKQPHNLKHCQIVFRVAVDDLRHILQDRGALEIRGHDADNRNPLLVVKLGLFLVTHDVEVGQNIAGLGIHDGAAAAAQQIAVVVRHQQQHGRLERPL
jgi:hypothetical protein